MDSGSSSLTYEVPLTPAAVVQNYVSGIWPTFAKKSVPLACCFAKLLQSLFLRGSAGDINLHTNI